MKKLAIVVGHTDNAEGASMAEPFNFVQEYEYNTILAALVKMYALDLGNVQVKIFLRDKRGIRLTYDAVEKWEADASIELHYNAFSGPAEGCMVLYGGIPRANMLASLTHLALLEVMDNRDRGAKHIGISERGGVNLNGGAVPRILIEPFFGSDKDDARRGLMQMHEIAKAILKSAVEFMF